MWLKIFFFLKQRDVLLNVVKDVKTWCMYTAVCSTYTSYKPFQYVNLTNLDLLEILNEIMFAWCIKAI